ncbi:MAG: A/G-specific adenine glycosylase, partial [Alphaproteobacteria bacterium]
QQTTVAAVIPYFERFTARWPRLEALAAADDGEVMAAWAGLGYYARARNLLACARRLVAEAAGAPARFPESEDALRGLPGIGPYTAAAIAAIAFDRPAVVVDGNVERVVARLFAVSEPLPAAKPRLRALAGRITPERGAGIHAEAMMDLGATVCVPRTPRCGTCPLEGLCAGRAAGIAAALPARAPRPERPLRRGTVWAARRADGAWLVARRPGRGLLGGMLAFPVSGLEAEPDAGGPPLAARWRPAEAVSHVFTHFRLELAVEVAELPASAEPPAGMRFASAEEVPAALPGLMRKVHRAALAALGPPAGAERAR